MRVSRSVLSLIAAATSLAVAAPAAAQLRPAQPSPPRTDQGVGIGVLGGITRSTIKGDAGISESVEMRNGFMAGVWFGGNRNGRVGFMGEIDYVVKGANEAGGTGEFEIRYLEIPAVFRVNMGSRTQEGTSFYVIAGPVFDVRLKATLDGVDFTDDYEPFDVGVLAGAGVEARRLGFEVRGNWGLRSIFDPGEGGEKARNFTLQFVGKIRIN